MKKLKGLLLAIVGVLALSIAMVKVNAATVIQETYTYDLTTITGVAQGDTLDVIAKSSANATRTLTMTVAPITVANITRYKTDGYLEVQCKIENFKEQFIFNTTADATVTMSLNTGGGSKTINYKIYDGESTTTPTKDSSVAAGSATDFTFDFKGSGKHIIEFSSTAKPGSNFKIYSIELKTSYESSDTPEQLAVAAIDRIGEVTYSEDSRTSIAAATSALNGLDTSTISNYSTYTTAVATFESLATAKKNAFTDAVTAIGTVTVDSAPAIQSAVDALKELLDTEKEEVASSITTLRTAQDEYFVLAYDSFAKKVIADELEAPVAYQEKTQLSNSIFRAYTGVTCETSSSEIQDGTAFTKRIKLNASATFDNELSKNVLSFEAKTLGTLKIVCVSASTSEERTLNIYREKTEVSSLKAVMTAAEATVQSVEIDQLGMYYIGSKKSGINILSVEFVPQTAPTVEANMYQQVSADGTLVRYITIVKGLTVEQLEAEGAYELHIQCGSVDRAAKCVVATKLMNNGEVYKAPLTDGGDDYTFDGSDGSVYIVCILQVKDATHQDFVDQELTATMTVNGTVLPAKTYTIA